MTPPLARTRMVLGVPAGSGRFTRTERNLFRLGMSLFVLGALAGATGLLNTLLDAASYANAAPEVPGRISVSTRWVTTFTVGAVVLTAGQITMSLLTMRAQFRRALPAMDIACGVCGAGTDTLPPSSFRGFVGSVGNIRGPVWLCKDPKACAERATRSAGTAGQVFPRADA